MYSEFIKLNKTVAWRNINLDSSEHSISMKDKRTKPFKYFKRSLKELELSSLRFYVIGFKFRFIIWYLLRYWNYITNLIIFKTYNILDFSLSNLKNILRKNINKKSIIFIGSQLNEGFQYSRSKILSQLKIISKIKNNSNLNIIFRPHPASFKERNYFFIIIKLLVQGIKIDVSPKLNFNKDDIIVALTSSIIYEALNKRNICLTFLPGFHNVLNVKTVDYKSINSLDKILVNLSKINENNNSDLENIISEYCMPGNLYYMDQKVIDQITNSFCIATIAS